MINLFIYLCNNYVFIYAKFIYLCNNLFIYLLVASSLFFYLKNIWYVGVTKTCIVPNIIFIGKQWGHLRPFALQSLIHIVSVLNHQ